MGLRLANGRVPSSLLPPGAPIRLVALPAAADGSGADKLAGTIYPGRVVDQTPGADGTSILLNVDVADSAAPTIALLGAQDRVAVVRDAGR